MPLAQAEVVVLVQLVVGLVVWAAVGRAVFRAPPPEASAGGGLGALQPTTALDRRWMEKTCRGVAGPGLRADGAALGPGDAVLVTGAAGFIGFHAALRLRSLGVAVVGLDNFNPYYDPALKRTRQRLLRDQGVYVAEGDLNDHAFLHELLDACAFTHVLHLAAQAGVRYAVQNPQAYISANVAGMTALLEALVKQSPGGASGASREGKGGNGGAGAGAGAGAGPGRGVGSSGGEGPGSLRPRVPKLVYASSSSVYGLNDRVPFREDDPVDRPASLYAATKRSDELIAHAYSHIYGLSATGLRFFTVYGPYGRPDMAYFDFTRQISRGDPIQVFQYPDGKEMGRDFTYIDDIVDGIVGALRSAPESAGAGAGSFRLFNLGNTNSVKLSDFIATLEDVLNQPAQKEFVELPATGDVLVTHADVSAAQKAFGYTPKTSLREGLQKFVNWYEAEGPR